GRPIIRGQGGNRVRITEDGLNSLDASALSPDHAVSAEPLLVDRVEILRGPANLLYGSSASGGVVNLVDNRIPEQPQDFSAALEVRGNTVADERVGVGRIDGGIGAFQFHVSGFARETDDYEIPGFALSEDERAELDADELAELERGVLGNSAQESDGATIGVSLAGDWGFAGVSYKAFDTLYGIPSGAHEHEHEDDDHGEGTMRLFGMGEGILEEGDHDEEEEEEMISIDLEQERYDVRAGLFNPLPGVEELRFGLATVDYMHVENEGDEVGTVYNIDATEVRLEAKFEPIGGFNSVIGVQYDDNDLEAVGEEAFIPPATTESLGLFALGEWDLDPFIVTAGLRWQDDEITLDDGITFEGIDSRDFTAISVSAGAIWRFTDDWQASVNWQRSERSPGQEELFSNGPHIATQAFEIGDPDLDEEVSNNIDIGIQKYIGDFTFRANFFYNAIEDYIYLLPTGEE
ncbi:MAG: TonB-dependent receptor, partial [Pseudomonadota bacterium]